MNNEALAELIKSAKNRIYELKMKMDDCKKFISFNEHAMEDAKRKGYWGKLGNIAHDTASIYFNMEAYQGEIDYLEKQIAKHQ